MPQLLFTPGKDRVPIVQEAGWAPGPVWMGVENLAPTGIRSPGRPARSQSLYRLRYMANHFARAVIESQRRVNYFLEVQRTMLLVLYHVTKTELRPAFSNAKSAGSLFKI
jgi:hypothetical protein